MVGLTLVALLAADGSSKLGDEPWIVFGSFRGGDFSGSIHAIRPDGTGERQLSAHPAGRPASLDPWSARDESVILFSRGGGSHRSSVWRLDGRTMQESKVTDEVMVRFDNGRAWPSMRPGHPSQLLYVREAGRMRRLALTDLTDGATIDLGLGQFPSWSPDGNLLAYVRDSRVWIQGPDGSDARPLGGGLAEMAYPSWSPTGNALVVSGSDGAGVDLYEVDTDGSVLRRLTHTPEVAEAAAVWSPNGLRVSFSAPSTDPADGWQHSIYVLDLEVGRVREITSGRFHDSRPTWTVRHAP